MPRTYETVLIFDSVLDESQVEDKLTRFKRALDGDRAPDTDTASRVRVDHWGKRKLAYPIRKKEQGTYVILRYETDSDKLTEFERLTRLDEQVLRQLTIVDPLEPAAPAAAPARPASGAVGEEE